jgi:hypothetical protein
VERSDARAKPAQRGRGRYSVPGRGGGFPAAPASQDGTQKHFLRGEEMGSGRSFRWLGVPLVLAQQAKIQTLAVATKRDETGRLFPR